MDDEFRDILSNYNEVTHALVLWAKDQTGTPFAETQDGKIVLSLIADIAKASALLLLHEMSRTLEDITLSMKNDAELQ